jgi:hypothetical protein
MTTPIRQHEGKKYLRCIFAADEQRNCILIDVYAVLKAFDVRCPARQQAIKKLLMAGERGKGSVKEDLMGALAAVNRALEIAYNDSGAALADPSTLNRKEESFPVPEANVPSQIPETGPPSSKATPSSPRNIFTLIERIKQQLPLEQVGFMDDLLRVTPFMMLPEEDSSSRWRKLERILNQYIDGTRPLLPWEQKIVDIVREG